MVPLVEFKGANMNTHINNMGRTYSYAYVDLVGRIVQAAESKNPAFTVCELAGICDLVGARRFVELCQAAYNSKQGWQGKGA